ncbi:MAG: branched-chain amino acid transport system substrate-binding protein [Rhodospirillaceae bacterium]|nr:branched-chain amino acid transport system substrate-binding protein [Rhodospirillaceae bacterium]
MVARRSGPTALAMAATLGLLAAILPITSRAGENDVITLGAAVSQTGNYATSGKHTRDGYDFAAERVNAMGGVKIGDRAYKLQIKYYDDESVAARSAELTERLVGQDGVKFILGPYGSPTTAAMAPVVEKLKVPMIEANGAARSLFTKGYSYTFAVLSTSDQYLSSAVDLLAEKAREQGKDPKSLRLALAMGDDNFSQDVRSGVLAAAKTYGMQIVIDDKLPDAFTDMSVTLTKVKALRPDALLVSGHEKGALTAVRQVAERKVKVAMLAMTHCDSADVIGQVGAAAEYTLCAAQWAPSLTYRDRWFGSATDYAKAFEARFHHAPPYQAAESSAAVLVYADAFQRAGSLDPQKVRDAIAATDMETFYGRIHFDGTGKNIGKPTVLLQVIQGQYKVVAPSRWATDKAVYPRPS